MKKLLLFAVVAVFSLNVGAQTGFGALGGLSIQSLSVDAGGVDASDSETGFVLGVFADLELSDQLGLQPELTYSSVKDFSMINLNAIVKYQVSEEFNIQAGPQIGFAGGDIVDFYDDLTDDFSKLNLQLAVGVGYDISEELFVQARYGFQLNDHYTGDDDASIKFNSLNATVGYRF